MSIRNLLLIILVTSLIPLCFFINKESDEKVNQTTNLNLTEEDMEYKKEEIKKEKKSPEKKEMKGLKESLERMQKEQKEMIEESQKLDKEREN